MKIIVFVKQIPDTNDVKLDPKTGNLRRDGVKSRINPNDLNVIETAMELKNRGVKDIFVLCADGLTGIGDAIEAAFPMTEYQRCIVHMVRNTLKYVADKDRKEFANDLKTIYHAPDEEQGYRNMQVVAEKWDKKYPRSMDRWKDN